MEVKTAKQKTSIWQRFGFGASKTKVPIKDKAIVKAKILPRARTSSDYDRYNVGMSSPKRDSWPTGSLHVSRSDTDFFSRKQMMTITEEAKRNAVQAKEEVNELHRQSKGGIVGRASRGVSAALARSVQLRRDDENYANKAIKTPANFLKWFFRFCLVTGFSILGVFIGGHIGCVIERGDRCREDTILLLEGKATSIIPWATGIIFGAIAAVTGRYIWNKFANKIEERFEHCQKWAKDSKCRIISFLGLFYITMTTISAVLGVVVEKYGENNIWPPQNNGLFKGASAGCALGILLTGALLLKPVVQCGCLIRAICCRKCKRTKKAMLQVTVLELTAAATNSVASVVIEVPNNIHGENKDRERKRGEGEEPLLDTYEQFEIIRTPRQLPVGTYWQERELAGGNRMGATLVAR